MLVVEFINGSEVDLLTKRQHQLHAFGELECQVPFKSWPGMIVLDFCLDLIFYC